MAAMGMSEVVQKMVAMTFAVAMVGDGGRRGLTRLILAWSWSNGSSYLLFVDGVSDCDFGTRWWRRDT
ncbi:hypothetical protein SESBI_40551 [Sesbania bispinosa]|nr:hypothetical protein SESBI_40551 [Sesbania bispinosa]